MEGKLGVRNAAPWSAPPVENDHVDVPVISEQFCQMIFHELNLLARYVEVPNVVPLTVNIKG